MPTECDVLVVGGGPAGAWTARGLAQRDFCVRVWDRARFPREKPCGECVSPGAVRLLAEGGAAEALRALRPEPIVGARIVTQRGDAFAGAYQAEDGPGYSLRRTDLDAMLLDLAAQAGAGVEQGTAFRVCAREDGCFLVEGRQDGAPVRVRCRALVGADGSHSAVARRMGVVRPIPRLQKVAFVAHARGIEGLDGRVEMHAGLRGCVGIGPGPDGAANVTVVTGPEAARAARDVPEFVRATVERYPGLAGRFDRAQWEETVLRVGTFGHTTRRSVADGVLLVGDAAAFIDPFTGEGIYFALRGAEMAANHLGAALRRGDVSERALMPYERDRRGEFGPKYALCAMVERVVGTPWLLSRLARRFRARPSLADDLVRTTGDILAPSARVFRPGFWMKLLG